MIFFGASGHAKVAIEAWVAAQGKVSMLVDDNPEVKELLGYPVSPRNQITKQPAPMVITIGANTIRKRIAGELYGNYGTIIHPQAVLSPSVTIGEGTVVFAGAILNASNSVGKHCIINTGSKIDHDCVIGDFCHVAPGATLCGGVVLEEGALVGAGATIIPLVRIGCWSVVGAGAVVTKHVAPFTIVAGNPARVIKTILP